MARVTWIDPGEGTRFPLRWRTRARAWWEGYDLSALKAEIAAAAAEPLPPVDTPSSSLPLALSAEPVDQSGRPLWTADRIQVAEALWGQDFLSPGGVEHTAYLVKPFGINPSMSILDLAAGLGGVARTLARDYKAWVTGMEPSPLLAQMGMERSEKAGLSKQAPITAYDPDKLELTHRYDGIFAKETFFTVTEKDRLFATLAKGLKDGGQLLFTDYCVEGEDTLTNPRLTGWIGHERQPPVLWPARRIVSALKGRKLDVRVKEDITDPQRQLVLTSLLRFTEHLASHALPRTTKSAVLDEVELWARRMDALDGGLRVYRFFCMKH